MRNLKRALSLALAAMMLIGMMVVSAGAASKDFTDKDEIKHTEAVSAMTTLNVISGKNDGSYFDPTGTLTRAEMAKLVTYILNGGVEPVLGEKVTPTYKDIDGHWAEKYIEYCTSMNIIAGDGSGKFNPEGTLTAEQCAKMLLTAMNYKDDIFGFLGNNWAINVNREANAAGLYKELGSLKATDPISRDDAAQMVYNAIQSKTMKLSWTQDKETGEISQHYELTGNSLFEDKFNGIVYEGVLLASGSMAPYGYAAGKEKLNIDAKYVNGSSANAGRYVLNFATDVTDMIGEYVKVLYNSKDKVVYGVYENKDQTTVVVNTNRGTMGVIESGDVDVEIDGVTYDFSGTIGGAGEPAVYTISSDTWVRVVGGLSNSAALGHDNRNDDQVKMVDNNGDGKIDVVFITPSALETVNYVGADTMTLTTLGSVKKADMNLADDTYAVEQKVFVTPKCASFNGNYGIAAATVVEGKVDAVRRATVGGTPNVVTAVQVNGEWYSLVATSTNKDLAVAGSVIVDDKGSAIALDSTYKFYVRGGYAYAADIVTSGGTTIAVITGVTSNTDFDGNTQLRLLKADGETVTGYMDWAANYPVSGFAEGQLVAYTVSDNIYTLYPLGNKVPNDPSDNLKVMAGYDVAVGIDGSNGTVGGSSADTASSSPVAQGTAFVAASGATRAKIAGVGINDDAVVFVRYDSNTGNGQWDSAWKVVSGKEVNSWKSNYGVAGAGLYKSTGLGFLDVAFIDASGVDVALPNASAQYAYVTSAISYGTDYATYSIWDGSSESSITVTEKTSSSVASKGAVISFDWDGEGVIKNVVTISDFGALTYTNGAQVKINSTAYDLADDVVILNVDTDKKVGVSGTAISKAQMTQVKDVYYNNVAFKLNTDGEISVLVVDVVNNKWTGKGAYTNGISGVTGSSNNSGSLVISLVDGLYTVDAAGNPTIVSNGTDVKAYFQITGSGSVTSAIYNNVNNTINLTLSGVANGDTLATQASAGSTLGLSEGSDTIGLTLNYTYNTIGNLWK